MGLMDQIDALVVGAGVVGLATARALALLGLEVIIIEREPHYGSGISSRNSEVIHAGHYYDTGSLKARMCVRGRHLMMDYCQARQLPHRSCGKLVVASLETDLPKLQALWQRGQANGVEDLSILSGQEARRLEPALAVAAALHSPRTGIVDSHAFMTALLGDAEGAGACLAVQTRFVRALKREGRWTVQTEGAEAFAVSTRLLVNCAGLGAQAVAHGLEGLPAQHIPPLHLAKGNYFALSGRSPFSRDRKSVV